MIKDIKAQNEKVQATDRVMEKLHADFPQCFNNEGKFDLEKFKSLVNDNVDVTEEGYDLNFLGKNYANLIASTETETVIQPDIEHNSKPENKDSQNIYISGDNLDALKHLLKSYAGKIKCIYIDPPYNTGSDGFVYNDKFNFTTDQLQTKLGIGEEKAKRILDLCKRGSASHSAWLMFMAPRLMLARDLLTEDGVIFISIDDNEQANLKLLCDAILGEENLTSQLVWEQGKKSMAAQIAINHEYCLCYCQNRQKNIDRKNTEDNTNWSTKKLGLEEIYAEFEKLKKEHANDFEKIEVGMKTFYKNLPDSNPSKLQEHYCKVDERGLYHPDNISQGTGNGGRFDIMHPYTNKPCKLPEGGWRFAEDKLPELLSENRIVFGKDETTVPCIKRYLKETEYNVFASVFYKDGRGASKRLGTLLGAKVFDNPKDEDTIKTLVQIATSDNDKKQIVLDFFSGSGTTSCAVMQLALENQKTSYQYISVQLPENIDEKYANANSDEKKKLQKVISFLDGNNHPHTLDYVGFERIRRSATKIRQEHPDYKGDLGFKHYILQDVPQNTLDKMETFNPNGMFGEKDILESFGTETVLATWMEKDGYGLTQNAELLQLANYTAYYCGGHIYMIDGEGFDEKAMIALVDKYGKEADFNPHNVVLFGYSFTYTQTEMLKKNLSAVKKLNESINIDIRY